MFNRSIFVVMVTTLVLVACQAPRGSPTEPEKKIFRPTVVVTSNDTGVDIGLEKGGWTPIQELSITVAGSGFLYLTAYGGEPVMDILPSDAYRFIGLKTLIGISPRGTVPPKSLATFVVACCNDRPFPYRVSAYSVSETIYLKEPGAYYYTLYAKSPNEGDGQTSVHPRTFTAIFIPD